MGYFEKINIAPKESVRRGEFILEDFILEDFINHIINKHADR